MFSQSLRSIWGRGYSGCALSAEPCSPHRVTSGPLAGFHSAEADELTHNTAHSRTIQYTIFFIRLFSPYFANIFLSPENVPGLLSVYLTRGNTFLSISDSSWPTITLNNDHSSTCSIFPPSAGIFTSGPSVSHSSIS